MLLPYINNIDMVLIMSVVPGKGGQEFIEETYKKILRIKKIILKRKARVKISVDGGVNDEVAKRLDFVDIIVSGSFITKSDDFEKSIELIRENASINEKKGKEKRNKNKEIIDDEPKIML